MIVVKGDNKNVKELNELTFIQRCEAFVKFHTTQLLVAFGMIYAFWVEVVPQDLKEDFFQQAPWIAKYKTWIYLAALAVSFYKTKMTGQVITVQPTKPTIGGIVADDPEVKE